MDRKWTTALCVGLLTLGAAGGAAELDLAAPESDARILGMAGAGTATAAGAGAVWWNAAGLADTPRAAFLLAHVGLRPGLEHQSGVLACRPFVDRSWVVALQTDVYREAGIAVDEALPQLRPVPPHAGYRAALHAAGEVGRGFALGAALGRMRGLPASVEPGPVIVADFGVRWRHAGTRAALSMRGVRLAGAGERAPVLSAGTSQALVSASLLCAAQLDRDPLGDLHPSAALEWRAMPALALRTGARYEDAERGTAATAGLGLQLDGIHLDYAVRLLHGEPAVHALAFGVDFGELPPAVPAAALEPRAEDRAPAPRTEEPVSRRPEAPSAPRTENVSPPRAAATVPPRTQPAAPPRVEDTAPPHVQPAAPPPTRRAPDARPPRPAPPVTERFAVYAGPFPNLETAAAAIVALRRIDLRPVVQTQGDRFFVVADRGLLRTDAEALQARAARAGVACALGPE